jgi:hypothetical protein
MKLTVDGGLTASVTQKHLLRDALMAQDASASALVKPRMRPITAVTVRSDADSSLTFDGLSAKIHFHLDLFLDDIDFDRTLFKVGGKAKESNSTESLAKDEEFVLRLGTGSRDGQPMTKPSVLSHFPGGPEFETFDQDVPGCLEDPTPNPTLPPPCKELDNGATPTADVCLYGSGSSLRGIKAFPPGVCANIAGYLSQLGGLGPAKKACVHGYLGFLCAPASLQQTFQGQSVVARLWNFDEAMSLALHKVVDDCANAFLDPSDPQLQTKIKDLGEHMVAPAVCTAGVKLLNEGSVIGEPTVDDLSPHTPQTACVS